MTYLSGARERIGYDFLPYRRFYLKPDAEADALGKFLLNRRVEVPDEMFLQVETQFYLLSAVGLKVSQRHLELWFGEADAQRARELLEELPPDSKKIVLGIGAGAPERKYPPEKLLVVLKELLKKNFSFVLVGGKAELEVANFLEKNLPSEKVLNLVGQTTLRETEAVISQMDLYLGNDTGVMHMAATARVPVIAIFPQAIDKDNSFPKFFNNVYKFPPYQTKAILLRPAHGRNSSVCDIEQITPQEILAAVEQMEHSI